MNNLSTNQQVMLLRLFEGDYPTPTIEGYYWADDLTKRVDGRTMCSLIKRDLVSDRIQTGCYGSLSSSFSLTESGKEIAEKLDEAEYQKRRDRRGW